MDARRYTLSAYGYYLLKTAVGFLAAALLVGHLILGQGLALCLLTPVLVCGVKLLSAGLELRHFHRRSILPRDEKRFSLLQGASVLLLAAAYLPPLLLNRALPSAAVYAVCGLAAAGGAWGAAYLLRFSGYRRVYRHLFTADAVSLLSGDGLQAAARETQAQYQSKLTLDAGPNSRKTGCARFNELFVRRNYRLLMRPARRTAVIAGAATTLAVFIPVAFMGGMMGRFFNSFGITVSTTIAISLLVSLTLTPFLCSRILGRQKIGPLQTMLERPFLWLGSKYKGALEYSVSHRKTVIIAALLIFIGGLGIAKTLGTEFFPNEDQGRLRVQIELPAESSLEVTENVIKEMVDKVQEDPRVAYTYGIVGSGFGEEVYKGTINIELIDRSKRERANVIMGQLRKKLAAFRDVDIKMGTWGGSDITLVIQGPTTESLADIGEMIKKDLAENARGLVDITTDLQMNKPRINLALNRALADDLNVNIRELSDELMAWFGGTKSGSFNEGGYRYDIRIRAEQSGRNDPDKIPNTLVKTESGGVIRAAGLVNSSIGMAPNVIKRYNRQRSLQIGANVEGISPGEGIRIMEEVFRKYAPQDGTYSMSPAGDSENMKTSFRYMSIALIFAIVLVYMVMAIQFESFLHPFTVMFSLPLMTAGSFGLLALMGLRISVMSFMGIILLVGVVVNNAILLVDFINQLRASGMEKVEAVIAAGPLRLRAILMTTVSTMIGSMPVALALSQGGEVRQPMSVAVIGGLFTSTLLTLLVIPVLYLVFDDIADKVKGKVNRFRAYTRMSGNASSKIK